MSLTTRAPRADELSRLSDLCFRSKAVWGYDAALSLQPRDLQSTSIAVAERDWHFGCVRTCTNPETSP